MIQSGPIEVDAAARKAQVVGDAPRVEPIPQAELAGPAYDLCVAVREGVGVTVHENIPEYMRTMVKHAGIFGCHMAMGSALFRGEIPARERELAVLRVAWLCRAPYEWGEHVEISQRYGVTAEEVNRVIAGSSHADWGAHDRAILRGVEELIGDQSLSQETWDALAARWNEAQLIEFPMMVGQYVSTAYVQNALRVRLADGNPGLSHRGGQRIR